jgi:DNA-binding CsgD family transcriptional regulator
MDSPPYDLGRWVDFAAESARGSADPFFIPGILDLLRETYGCTAQWTCGSDDGRVVWVFVGVPPAWPAPGTTGDAAAHVDRQPLSRWFGRTGGLHPVTSGRVPGSIADRRIRATACEVLGTDMDLELAIPAWITPHGRGAFVLWRGGRDFSRDHVELATQIQPLLMLLARLSRSTAHQAVPLQERFNLTDREVMVLSLLRQGLTQASIARRLGCAPRTVEKHLERAYRKLGVHDRLDAVRRIEARDLPSGVGARPAATPTAWQHRAQRPDLVVLSRTLPRDDQQALWTGSWRGRAANRGGRGPRRV